MVVCQAVLASDRSKLGNMLLPPDHRLRGVEGVEYGKSGPHVLLLLLLPLPQDWHQCSRGVHPPGVGSRADLAYAKLFLS